MKLITRYLVIGLVVVGFLSDSEGMGIDSLSANQILLNSLIFDGSIKNLEAVSSIEFVSAIDHDGTIISIVTKRIQSRGYLASILAPGYKNTTTIFHLGQAVVMDSKSTTTISDRQKLDELELQTFIVPEPGYYKLKYTIERLQDQKFTHFDCYVIKATSENGYATLNYFDKTNFRLIMIVYPTGRKSLLTDYTMKENVLIHTRIVHVDERGQTTTSEVESVRFNLENEKWFNLPDSGVRTLPQSIRIGSFSVVGYEGILTRTETNQTETYNQQNILLNLNWMNQFEYKLALPPNASQSIEDIFVKIVQADNEGYFCHYHSKKRRGTQSYLTRK